MSRQYPLHIMDSDEDPTEGSFDSNATTVPVDPQTPPRATSDDSGIDSHIPPPMPHVTTPVVSPTAAPAHYSLGEPSHRPVLRRTPRMSVRDLPTRQLAPRDKAPMTDTETQREEPPPKRLRPTHLDWMPPMLRRWRSLEGIPSTFEPGQSSHTPLSVSITGEPLELTVPTLVAVIRTVFRLHQDIQGDIRELMSDTSRLDGDVASIYVRLDTMDTHVDVDRESADATRARVDVLERRAAVAGVIAGVSLLMTLMMTAVGLYLPYYR